MRRPRSGGGWQAIRYTLRKGREVGFLRLWRAMRSKNACKTCALGMGGQQGGMADESGHFPEVCKKSLQAMAADMRGKIHPRFFEEFSAAQMQQLSPRELELAGRIVEPVILRPGETHYRAISWDAAFEGLASSLRNTSPERAFFYASGRSSNEAGFLLQLFGRAFGTNHVNNCSFYCHQASGVGLTDSIGSGVATVTLEDLEKCDLVFLIGGNPASNHPRLMTQLMKLRSRGGKVVVVNPVREAGLENFRVPSSAKSMLFGSEIASHYVQPTIGGDIAFLAGMAKCLIEIEALDDPFLHKATEGVEALVSFLEGVSWSEIESASGLKQEDIRKVSECYAQSECTIFAWTMGITHHLHGVENVQWIANLALLRGMVGKAGAGLLPIRGHSNVQGMGSMGVSPAMRQQALESLAALGLKVPEFKGYDTMAAMEAAHRGEMDFALCLGGNLYGANPAADWAKQALSKIGAVVYLSTTLNTGHAHGLGKTTLILPVCARDEEDQCTTQESMFSYVRLSEGGPARHEGPRTEVAILSELAAKALGTEGPLEWASLASHDAVRELIAKHVPGYDGVAEIGKTKQEFEIPGRALRDGVFPTASGRAALRAHPIPAPALLAEKELRLMTVRSEGQFNTVVYEETDIYRGQDRRDVILMNSEDLTRLGLAENQTVTVSNSAGSMRVLARSFDIAKGCALMYYPEANVLVSNQVDPRSKTPAFKSAVVTVRPAAEALPESLETMAGNSANRDGMKAC